MEWLTAELRRHHTVNEPADACHAQVEGENSVAAAAAVAGAPLPAFAQKLGSENVVPARRVPQPLQFLQTFLRTFLQTLSRRDKMAGGMAGVQAVLSAS
jgi:hypothetical protein